MVDRPRTGSNVIEVPTGRMRWPRMPLVPLRCRCRHCHGSGWERPAIDPATLIAAIVADFGLLSFTTAELQRHAAVVGGRLQALLEGRDARQVGWVLKQSEGVPLDGYRLQRLGKERNRIALWRVLPVL